VNDRALRAAGVVLALAGLAVTSYLTYSHYADDQVFCSTGGCETVLRSRYADLAGIPVAVLGLAGYAAILAALLVPGELASLAAAVLSTVGLAFGVYLIVIQVAVLEALCQWCLTSDGVLFALAVLTCWRVARFAREARAQPELAARQPPPPRPRAAP
jgi:uncharacterized membrane protein